MFLLLTLNIFTPFPSVSIVYFEQENVTEALTHFLISCHCLLLITLKTSGDQRYYDIFRGIKRENWEEMDEAHSTLSGIFNF